MAKFMLLIFVAAAVGLSSALTHSQALTQLQNAGIGIRSSGSCSDKNNKRCTSLDGIRQNTITGLVNLKKNSNCPITVTGGTETGHSCRATKSHCNGYKADISLSKKEDICINNYITKNYVASGTRSDGASLYKDGSGNIYAKEGNHWDIVYN